jgi:hypothetical protein
MTPTNLCGYMNPLINGLRLTTESAYYANRENCLNIIQTKKKREKEKRWRSSFGPARGREKPLITFGRRLEKYPWKRNLAWNGFQRDFLS